MPSKTQKIYSVSIYRVGYGPPRLCRTPEEVAQYIFKDLSAYEKKCVTQSNIADIIRTLRKGKELRMFDALIKQTTLFG